MGDYTVAAMLIDEIVGGREGRPIILVWAAGNEVTSGCPGTFKTIPPPSPAKNTISVGAVSSLDEEIAFFSSRGPTDDGRLRPDVAAPGHEKDGLIMKGTHSCVTYIVPLYMDMSGTSQASPVVTGAVALALEYWQREIGGDDPSPALVKALVIHGAVDLGEKGPDYTYGYGGLRIPPILDLIGARAFKETTLDQGQTYRAQFTKTDAAPVKVTLAWTDPPGELLSARNLVNDLNLLVIGPDGAEHLPWLLDPANPAQPASTGVDTLNPVEQVLLEGAPTGDYEVVIAATDVPSGPQAASYVFTGLTFVSDGLDDDDDDNTPGDDDDNDDNDDDDAATDDDDDDSGGCGC
jgi:hypothetical protein